jgi:hypothetical protein
MALFFLGKPMTAVQAEEYGKAARIRNISLTFHAIRVHLGTLKRRFVPDGVGVRGGVPDFTGVCGTDRGGD